MLESNTEAKQATGTGSKLGHGCGREGDEGPSLPLRLQPRLRDLAFTMHPRELGTRVPQVSQGWQGGDESKGPRPPHLAAPLIPFNHNRHPTVCVQLQGAEDSDSLWDYGA